jgi:hypothetical protein
MWQKLKEQIPAVIVTAVLVIAAAAIMVQKITRQQRLELEPLRAQNEMLRAQGEENRNQIAATTKLLKETVAQFSGGGLHTEEQIAKLNDERLTRLAEVIAKKVVPELPAAKSPAELEQSQNEQVDKVASRLAENIKPVLAGAIAEQKAGALDVARQSEARVAQLNAGLLATQAAAQDALALSHELSALYLDSYKDKGVVMRLFSLPANLVIDAAHMNFVTGNRAAAEKDVTAKIDSIEKRLREVQSMASISGN